MESDNYNPEAIRKAFQFLVDEYGYTVVRDEEFSHEDRPYAFMLEYTGNDRRVLLNHDYKENFFYFKIIRGLETPYPNDADFENIIPFLKIFKTFDPLFDPRSIHPDDKTCAEAAELNAQLLKKYGASILRGEDWL